MTTWKTNKKLCGWDAAVSEGKKLLFMIVVFAAAYWAPLDDPRMTAAVLEAFHMLQEYAREHVLFCLIPAFFIAGAVANFVSQGAVIQYFGSGARRWVSYSVASVSGVVLAVCSCTVLPLFAGIYRRGAGIGPAAAFLYAGPAINLLAVIMTARVLGWELGVARAVGAVVFAIVIGLAMAALYGSEDAQRTAKIALPAGDQSPARTPLQNAAYFAVLVLILITATWSRPADSSGFFYAVFQVKWLLVAGLLALLAFMVARWFDSDERASWLDSTWDFAKQIMPLLFGGVLIAGLLMGRPGTEAGLIPSALVEQLVGGSSLRANLFASVVGAFMYFATLTEVPILQGLLGAGMGPGPALALLLSGPALSLPNMLVIQSVLGTKKTLSFIVLVVIMATLSGLIYGTIFAS